MKHTIAAILMATLTLASCRTIREAQTVETHDTVTLRHTDTVAVYRLRTVHDTIHLHTDRTVTLAPTGDTLRMSTQTVIRERIVERDSASHTAHATDSLAATHAAKSDTRRRAQGIDRRGLVVLGIILGVCLLVITRLGPPMRRDG